MYLINDQQMTDATVPEEDVLTSMEKLRKSIETKVLPWIGTISPLIWFTLISIWLYTALRNLVGT